MIVDMVDGGLRHDGEIKLSLCARRGIPEDRIVELESRRLDIHGEPDARAYREAFDATTNDAIAPSGLPAG